MLIVLYLDHIARLTGLFGGLVGWWSIASLVDYYASAEERLRLFIIPESIGFVFLGLMVYYGKSCKKQSHKDRTLECMYTNA